MELEDNFHRFLERFKAYRQEARKNYNTDAMKHIAMKMINECVKGEGKIIVFGDKDPDGIFSSMIVKVYLERLMRIYRPDALKNGSIGIDIRYSDREKDGFGLSKATYDELSEAYSLIITTDNGTSSGFHSYSIDNLIVIDHHPANEGEEVPKVPYILNPNLHRQDGLEHSTSGGMVAYDVVRFIDSVLREQNKHYKTYLKNPDNHHSHTLMLEVLKEYAAFTLVSDMAVLDMANRRFVLEAFKTIRLPIKQDQIPLYLLFEGEYTQNKLSFNIIPKINIDRMGELHTINPSTKQTYMESFIRPKTFQEFEEARDFILKVDAQRKKLLNQLSETVQPQTANGIKVAFVDHPGAKVGLSGLIANRLQQKSGKPAIVAIPSSDGTKLSISGRGTNIKTVLSALLPKSGGHSDACGGSMQIESGEKPKDTFERLLSKIATLGIIIPERKTEVVNDQYAPVAWEEAVRMSRIYADVAENVEMSKAIRVAVYQPKITSYFTYKSGWGKVGFGEGRNKAEILINSAEFPESSLANSKVIIFDLIADGSISIHKAFETLEEYMSHTVQLKEAEGFGIKSEKNDLAQSKLKTISGSDIAHHYAQDATGDNIFYYSSFDDFEEVILEDGLIIVPSYVNERNPHRKRDDILEFFVGEDRHTPLGQADLAGAYKDFASRLVSLSRQKEFIFIKDGLLNDPLISDQAKMVAKKIISSVAKKEEGGANERDKSIHVDYQHANAS